MKLEKDLVIELPNGKKYVYTDEVNYNNIRYILIMNVNDEETEVNENDILFVTEEIIDNELHILPVTDLDLIVRLTKMIKD